MAVDGGVDWLGQYGGVGEHPGLHEGSGGTPPRPPHQGPAGRGVSAECPRRVQEVVCRDGTNRYTADPEPALTSSNSHAADDPTPPGTWWRPLKIGRSAVRPRPWPPAPQVP